MKTTTPAPHPKAFGSGKQQQKTTNPKKPPLLSGEGCRTKRDGVVPHNTGMHPLREVASYPRNHNTSPASQKHSGAGKNNKSQQNKITPSTTKGPVKAPLVLHKLYCYGQSISPVSPHPCRSLPAHRGSPGV